MDVKGSGIGRLSCHSDLVNVVGAGSLDPINIELSQLRRGWPRERLFFEMVIRGHLHFGKVTTADSGPVSSDRT
jgi:hypothetical protein